MARSKKPKTIQQVLIPHIRRASRFWPPKAEARKQAARKVQVGTLKNGKPKFETFYECSECTKQGIKKLHPKENTQMDHIIEVASITGFDNWDAYISRMFPTADGYQCLCLDHHKEKTLKNQKLRRSAKKINKKS